MADATTIFSLEELTAVTPLDGRYRSVTAGLTEYLSEYALIKTRVEIEAKYLIALSAYKVIRRFSSREKDQVLSSYRNFTLDQAREVKQIEKETRHDVKAMERIFRKLLSGTNLEDVIEQIHMGLTSEDVNNLAYRLLLKRATHRVFLPILTELLMELLQMAQAYRSLPMMARTHGQAAVPTTLGKELVVFASRLDRQIDELKKQQLTGKLSGAVGNFNALQFAYPKVNWIHFSRKFIESLGFKQNPITTQINAYDDMVSYFQIYQRIHSILIDLDQDMWRYISDNWFTQKSKKGEIGSSTMPHKVNPIDFENSEGNLGLANSLLEFFSRKLMISRLQRDLSDSTVIRNVGTALGFALVGYQSTLRGLARVVPNAKQIMHDLEKDWSVLTEAAQTILRKMQVRDAYSQVVSSSRGKHLTKAGWGKFVSGLPLNKTSKTALKKLSPKTYLGLASNLTEQEIKRIRSKYK